MTFAYTISVDRGVLSFPGTSGIHGIVGPAIPASVTFECRYASCITLSSSQFVVTDTSITDQTFAFGSMDSNFQLGLYEDSTFTTPQSATIFIGSTIYTAATFSLSSLANQIEFFIDSCVLKVNIWCFWFFFL